jgi:hypothetical protein
LGNFSGDFSGLAFQFSALKFSVLGRPEFSAADFSGLAFQFSALKFSVLGTPPDAGL